MLKIENFSKSYDGGKTYAVKNLNLEIKAGEIVAFIGHNGSGKSTTLKAVAGVLGFDEGDIFVDNISIKQNAYEAKKIISYLPETIEVFEFIKGIDYLNFIADVFEVNPQVRQQRIEKYSKMFKIDTALKQTIDTYSHGMKQKVAIIASLIHEPKLLLLDEPFFGLDPKSSFDFKEIMQQLIKDCVCIFYSTHLLDVAEKLATSVVIIHKGEVIKQGKTSAIIGDKSLEKMFLEISANE